MTTAEKPTTADQRLGARTWAGWKALPPFFREFKDRLIADVERLEKRHAACESILEESDEWKRIAQGTSDGRRLAEAQDELTTLKEENERAVGLLRRCNEVLEHLGKFGSCGTSSCGSCKYNHGSARRFRTGKLVPFLDEREKQS